MQTIIRFWHDFRTPILVVALIILSIVHLWTKYRKGERHNVAISSSSENVVKSSSKPLELKNVLRNQPEESTVRTVRTAPKRIVGSKPVKYAQPSEKTGGGPTSIQPIIFYCSLSGSTEKVASALYDSYSAALNAKSNEFVVKPWLLDLSRIDYDEYFTSTPKRQLQKDTSILLQSVKYFYIILIPTYNIDSIVTSFLGHLDETHHDFRVDTAPLSDLAGYAVFGLGDRVGWPTEQAGFCAQAVETDKWLAKLTGRKRAYPLGMGDLNGGDKQTLEAWMTGVRSIIEDLAVGRGLGEGVPGSGDALESEEEDEVEDNEEEQRGGELLQASRKPQRKSMPIIDDMETVGSALSRDNLGTRQPLPTDFTTFNISKNIAASSSAPKEMVPKSSPTYNALAKQGYTIVGSHSGVKICRWTKSALRGRGSCYKFSFYGIKSHLCMETTPSLSCSNKCVFCWRHGTNPVGTTWRWQVDPPELIFEGVKKGHYAKIKMMRGVPGVRAERFEEAMRIRHCALSLVGEPIFYPYINDFTYMLHKERISSFLVCNAQHPDQLAALDRVTQLYVSIDASNKDSLRKIDRPLHRDFWERFCQCLDILRQKRFHHRTVFRLTLVKGFNVEDEVEGYANLVERGLPCFVEIKGVTYCGTSSSAGAGLTMKNVPFYEEVCEFVLALNAALQRKGLDYGIAAEHAHSCCVLIASKRFLSPSGKWRTVIDYDTFFELLESGAEFTPEQYTAETPAWALWGNGGFDPADERFRRKGKKEVAVANS